MHDPDERHDSGHVHAEDSANEILAFCLEVISPTRPACRSVAVEEVVVAAEEASEEVVEASAVEEAEVADHSTSMIKAHRRRLSVRS